MSLITIRREKTMTMRFSTVSDYSIRLYCISSLVAVLFLALLPTSARAQDQQAAAPWVNVTVVHVKPGQAANGGDMVITYITVDIS